jgi:predicted ATPase with chaperone activity
LAAAAPLHVATKVVSVRAALRDWFEQWRPIQAVQGPAAVKWKGNVIGELSHNILMQGPPSAGKALLARTVPSILPRLSIEEALEVTKVYSVAGMLPSGVPLVTQRPFRAPHHTTSHAGLVGGGRWPRPGEINLAHRGVLFLDELPEFGQNVLGVLRQPLEDRIVTISRAQGTVTYPANFMLVAAMNPWVCGHPPPIRVRSPIHASGPQTGGNPLAQLPIRCLEPRRAASATVSR